VKPPEPVLILDCGHVEWKKGKCATTDCPNFLGDDPRPMLASMLAIALMLLWVRFVTGRGAIEIIMDALPDLPGL
jgi:hypothetical protein